MTYFSGADGRGLSSKDQTILGAGIPLATHLNAILCPGLAIASVNVVISLGGLSKHAGDDIIY